MILVGDVPSPVNPPAGCRFNPRCPYAEDNCRTDEPPLAEVRPGHLAACHYWDEVRGWHQASQQPDRDSAARRGHDGLGRSAECAVNKLGSLLHQSAAPSPIARELRKSPAQTV